MNLRGNKRHTTIFKLMNKYKHISEVRHLEDVNRKLSSNWDLITTKTKREVEPDGSFKDEITYILGEGLMDEDCFS